MRENGGMIKPSNIQRHEMIGFKCEARLKGGTDKKTIMGTVIDETRNTLMLSTRNGKKTMVKEKYDFVFRLDNKNIVVNGASIVGRPQERIKKKIDKW